MKNSKKLFLLILLNILFTNLNLNGMDNSATQILENKTTYLLKDVILHESRTYKGKCIIEGNGSYLDFTQDGSITVAENSTLHLKNIKIKVDQATYRGVLQKIKLASNTSKILIEGNVIWEIENCFIFDSGSIIIQNGIFTIRNSSTYMMQAANFIYKTPEKITIQANSILRMENIFFTYSPPNNQSNLIETENKSIIQLVNSTIILKQNLQLLKVWVMVDETLQLIAKEKSTLILGDGEKEENNAPIDLYPGTKILNTFGEIYDNRYVLYNNKEFYEHNREELHNNNVNISR